eukprot:CAMPEP_0206248850 /NCGR_PEP_ID=MMETSP0047_2-20121206/20592_1 /ASSEMBLY_ACC=CAM_ASM_000192 /TAXON_ID=195065 /ORGANISM="Chroomonas mesostigmatica_cf, Strain CCMP1168" /LENGTH=48 /DNA_ID= /DNA_START= /DNA_END= /DNA_ORIENTATION=
MTPCDCETRRFSLREEGGPRLVSSPRGEGGLRKLCPCAAPWLRVVHRA